jgi:trimethylguanosine synthase
MAKHIAAKVSNQLASCKNPVESGKAAILDGFCGIGGNLIQFSRKCGFCLGVDMDPQKLQYCRHNSEVYALKDNKEFVLHREDFLNLSEPQRFIPGSSEKETRQFDAIFISPPWGGTGY